MSKKTRTLSKVWTIFVCCALTAVVFLSPAEAQLGDFNFDGSLDCDDIDALVSDIVNTVNNPLYDMDGSGTVDQVDITEWLTVAGNVNIGTPYGYGDSNLDSVVDGQDFIIWNNVRFQPASGWCASDFNADGIADIRDWAIWNEHKFTTGNLIPLSNVMAMNSGTPSDSIPDVYYFAGAATITTSVGPVTRPAGTLLVDTDGTDMAGIAVGGPDVTGTCELCDDGFMPDPGNPPFFVSVWKSGAIDSSTQWIRASPLVGTGFQGVIGEYADPNGFFPDDGLADYGTSATFLPQFADLSGGTWQVYYVTNSGKVWLTNTTTVPEPSSALILLMALGVAILAGIRRS